MRKKILRGALAALFVAPVLGTVAATAIEYGTMQPARAIDAGAVHTDGIQGTGYATM